MGRTLRAFVLFTAFGFLSGSVIAAAALEAQAGSPPSGPPSGPSGGRDLLWSQPPDLNGHKVPSEIIDDLHWEIEVADDFVMSGIGYFGRLVFWGGYLNWSEGDSGITALNVRIYTDQASAPGELLAELLDDPVQATFVGYDPYGFPTYMYEVEFACFDCEPGSRYWISVQACDHPLPQWGRVQALTQIENQAMFRSTSAGYPEWTAVSEIYGMEFDVSFEVDCVVIPGMPSACCLPSGGCTFTQAVNCGDFLHGRWHPCLTCAEVDCPDAEACCFADGSCQMLTDFGCADLGGTTQGPGTICEPNPCEATAGLPTTWGQIRTGYR